MKHELFAIIYLPILFIGNFSTNAFSNNNVISSDSAFTIAIMYLNGKSDFDKNTKDFANIEDVVLDSASSPYFRKFLQGRSAWEITFKEANPILSNFNKSRYKKPLDLKVYIDMLTGELLKVSCWADSISFDKDKSEKVEKDLLHNRFSYDGIADEVSIPFLDIITRIPANICDAKSIEAFNVKSEDRDGTNHTYWHIVLYELPTYISIPVPQDNSINKYENNSGDITVRKDVVFDCMTGKIIYDMELR